MDPHYQRGQEAENKEKQTVKHDRQFTGINQLKTHSEGNVSFFLDTVYKYSCKAPRSKSKCFQRTLHITLHGANTADHDEPTLKSLKERSDTVGLRLQLFFRLNSLNYCLGK